MPVGKLLGFIFLERGITLKPDKIDEIVKMEKQSYIRDVQRIASFVTAVSRFISRLREKALPLYRLMKKSDRFEEDAIVGSDLGSTLGEGAHVALCCGD
jgi:hypothetical protein